MLFIDRADAGRHLAQRLRHLRGIDVVVLGLPRGGVPVAFEVAEELRAPLDVIVVRKLGVPFQPEYGFGAIGEGGARIIDDRVVRLTRLTGPEVAAVEARERAQLDHRVRQLRGDRTPIPLAGRTVIVVDDGIATGSTAWAACMVARARGAGRVILAVPVGSVEAAASLRRAADEVICLHTPARFFAIGEWYDDFSQVSDEEVTALLGKAARLSVGSDGAELDPAEIVVDAGGVRLPGSLVIPAQALGLVIFAHGSGSSRRSPRNQFVAAALNRVGLGTLLVDLLTADEELSRAYVFNIAMLAGRLNGNYLLAARPARRRHPPVRLLRGEHRRGRGPVGGGRQSPAAGRGGRVPRWPPGPGGPTASAGAGAHPAYRGWRGRGCPRPQPPGTGEAEV